MPYDTALRELTEETNLTEKDFKLFKFINKKIQMKYKLSNEHSSNIIFYLYNLIKKLD